MVHLKGYRGESIRGFVFSYLYYRIKLFFYDYFIAFTLLNVAIMKTIRPHGNSIPEFGADRNGGMEMPQSGNEYQIKQAPIPEKAPRKNKKDQHFPNFGLDNLLRKLFESPQKHNSHVTPGQVAADLGCGPGYFTLAIAECVGPGGRVYAVDSYLKAIQALEKKASKRGLHNIEMHVSSAADLGFIPDRSVDFVLADGLLCCVAPADLASVVNEMKRILKSNGKAYLKAGRGFPSYMDDATWEEILSGFTVVDRNTFPYKGDYWALVAL